MKIYCADISCDYNKDGKCSAKTVTLSYHSVMTVWEGRQQYNKCKTYEESAESRQLMKMLGGMIQSERGDV